MGCVFRPSHTKHGKSTVARLYWLQYRDASGGLVREPAKTAKRQEALRLLHRRTGAAAEGRPTSARADQVTVRTLLDHLDAEYKANGRDSDRLTYSLAHLRPAFEAWKAVHVTTDAIRTYTVARQGEGAANGTINRELAALKRAYTLATQATPPLLHTRPYIPMLVEDNIRQGFFERAQFEAVCRHLPEPLRPVATFMYITGWRIEEALTLTWAQVDLKASVVSLYVGETKNKRARTFPFTPELRACLEAQRRTTDATQRAQGAIIPWVFHRTGRPIRDLYKSWRAACQEAGCPGRIPHDFRRTAVRNLVRAGVPERVAMQMTGHRTRSVFDRYDIVSEGDLMAAATKLAAFEAGRCASQQSQCKKQCKHGENPESASRKWLF